MYNAEELAALRLLVGGRMSAYRFSHTLGVEKEAAALASLFCPEKEGLLRAAALLHDCTKECSNAEQIALMHDAGIALRQDEEQSPKIWHGITAPLLIQKEFPQFANKELLNAVRYHTTARAGLSLSEAILYLADYIEEGRPFAECKELRAAFWGAAPQNMPPEERLQHLKKVLLSSLEYTVSSLLAEGKPVTEETADAAAWLKLEKNPFEGE